jgi:hypothetical protein
MSEMTGDPGQNDALAAEYVLGTLDFEERGQAQALLGTDENFAAKVKVWERRLGELHLMVEPVEPDGRIWERIKVKVPQAQPGPEITPAEPKPQESRQETPQQPAPQSSTTPSPTPAAPTPSTLALSAIESALSSPDKAPATTAGVTPAPSLTAPSDAATRARAEPSPAPKLVPPVLSPAQPPAPAAPVLTPGGTRAPSAERADARDQVADLVAKMGRRVGRWRAFAVLMTLLVLAVAALLAAWRFVPERVPPQLQPVELMRLVGVSVGAGPAPRPPAPPESQFDE